MTSLLPELPKSRAPRRVPNCERTQTFASPKLQTTASLLLRNLQNIRYETVLSPEQLAGSNVEFSRHAARKPMVARYRRMPHGRLQFIVGTSFAATDLLQLTATIRLLHAHCRAFGVAGDNSFAIAALRQILSCVRRRANLEICEQPQRKTQPRLPGSERPKPFNCRMPKAFGLHSPPRPLAKLSCQSSKHRTGCKIAAAPRLLSCRATKLPRVRYRAHRD